MTLPDGFLFSQSNLQDYVDCQRRFQLKHMLHQSWPAVEAEPYLENERLIDLGARFHKIIRQYLIGIPETQISQSISNEPVLQLWWSNYRQSLKDGTLGLIVDRGTLHYEEITLSIPISQFRLVAKYDLLLNKPDGKLIIYDWKTSQNHPKHAWLAGRLQTHVYPFVLAGAASGFMRVNLPDPTQIEMIYWFTNQPEQPERFPYNQTTYQQDASYLENLITTISNKSEPVFPLTPDTKRCQFCTYRSLCNRGVKPGDLLQTEEWLEPDAPDEVSLDFDNISEIEF